MLCLLAWERTLGTLGRKDIVNGIVSGVYWTTVAET